MAGGRSMKDEFLLSAMTFLNWLWDTSVYMYNEAGRRCGRGWAAFSKDEEVWHIFENGAAYPYEVAEGDQPQWVYNVTRNHLISSAGGGAPADPAAIVEAANVLRPCEFIGGGIRRGEAELYDMTDFLSSVRINVVAGQQPSIRVLVWAWAAWTGRREVGWVASQRETYSVVLMDANADERIVEGPAFGT
jgi:hypothetical protein